MKNLIRRITLLAAVVSVPLLMFFQVFTAYQYKQAENRSIGLEKEQKEWLEKNKKLIAGISVLKAPERIETIALNELKLQKLSSDKVIRLAVKNQE